MINFDYFIKTHTLELRAPNQFKKEMSKSSDFDSKQVTFQVTYKYISFNKNSNFIKVINLF